MSKHQAHKDRQTHSQGAAEFSGMRATDFKFTKRIERPQDLPSRKETQIQMLKNSVEEELCKYASKNKEQRNSNLTRSKILGRKEVAQGIKEKGWHVSVTDKSQKIVLGLKDNYKKLVEPYTPKDKEVTMEEVTALETQLYYHTTAILRSFGVGRQHEEEHDREASEDEHPGLRLAA